jgi:membrane fusion protein, copper/silver efflux system
MKTILHFVRLSVLTLLGMGLAAAPAVGVPAKSHDHREVIEISAVGPATQRNTPLPASAVALLKPVALATADGAAALAADDLAGYKKTLPAVRTALVAFLDGYAHAEHGPLAGYKRGLADPADLTAARRQFEPFSTAVADLAQGARLHESAKLHVFQCSMTPVLGKARWLQRDSGTKNPFFGARMPRCGSEIATGETAIVLPPGHPPLDAATIAAFMRPRSVAPARSEGLCGSCGMSQAAMAAGEPCGDGKKQ